MSANRIDVLLRNNTGNKDKHILIDNFVVRTKIFQNVFSEIESSISDKPEQNYLLIGQRGSGKTTLLYRLKYAIEDDEQLNKWLIPVILPEEQYNITELFDLWETIAEYLEDNSKWKNISIEINQVSGKKNGEELAYGILEKHLKQNGKKIVVFIENINQFFKKIGSQGQKQLREVLLTATNIRLIGSATSYFDEINNYSEPFYDFFKVYQLKGLNKEECKRLLLNLGSQYDQLSVIENIIKNNPKRIESLRRLTGGVPRIISYLFQIFLDNQNGRAIIDLYKLLDELTFLYKAELDQLSPQQQKIVDIIARNWDAISVKDITQRTRIDSKHVSSVLNTLEKNQVIEIVSTKTKNNLYRLRERFLNIWYLMRFGKKREKENIIWLVRFYDAWCDKTELSKKVSEHLNNLKDGGYDTKAALDMNNTFLSCENLPTNLKYDVYKTTKAILPRELIKKLTLSNKDLSTTIKELIRHREYDKAIIVLNDLGIKDKIYYWLLSFVYLKKGDYKMSIELLEKIFEFSEDPELAYQIGWRYRALFYDKVKAIKYLNIALEKKYYKAAIILGNIYHKDKDTNNAIKYYRIAIENGDDESIMALADVYYEEKNLTEAEILCRRAIDNGNIDAINNLGIIQEENGKTDEAIKTYRKAIGNGQNTALINLGNLLLNIPKPDWNEAEALFKTAVQKDVPNANCILGKLYLRSKDYERAIECFNNGILKKEAGSAHQLAHYYEHNDKWSKAEKLFIKAFVWGEREGLMCLFDAAFSKEKNNRKEFIFKEFEKNIKSIYESGPIMIIKYAKLLLWNDKVDGSITKLINNQQIGDALQIDNEEFNEWVISELTDYFILLISKGQYNAAYSLFANEDFNFKQILKPVYYALMNYMKKEYPQEYLKAGDELTETVEEIIKKIEDYRVKYKLALTNRSKSRTQNN